MLLRLARALAVTLALSGGCRCASTSPPDPNAVPALQVPRVEPASHALDGRLKEPFWQRAAHVETLVDPGHGKPVKSYPIQGSVRIAWTNEALLVAFAVTDSNPTSPFGGDEADPHVWERASGVELMLQPGDPNDNRSYYEIQVGARGAVWDTRFDDYNRPITRTNEGTRYGHMQWRSELARGVQREASGYTVELALPWRALHSARTSVPPQPGDTWRANFYIFTPGQRHALAWSPLLGQGNFHRASRFGRLHFIKDRSGD